MEMLQLRYFYESAMAESFTKTAQKYMVPASSVSASVKRLEQELGTELFVRKRNRIQLNETGKRFLATVSNTLTQLDVTVNAISQQSAEKQTISILAKNTRSTLVYWIARFYRMCPTVSFQMTFDDTPENYGNYDIIVSPPEEGLEKYESFSWRRFVIRVEAVDTDPICRGPVTLSQMRDRVFVTTSIQRKAFQLFENACERQGFTPKVFLACDDYECRTKALMTGLCLGLNVGERGEESRIANTQFLSVADFNEELAVNVYYKKEVCDGDIQRFLELLKSSSLRP